MDAGFVIITPHFTTIGLSKIRHDQSAVQDIQSRTSQYMLDSINHKYIFCNFVSYNVNMIIPVKLRVHMHTQEFCDTLDKFSPFMHTVYVSSQLRFVNTMKFVFVVFKESLVKPLNH